jgi:hypothetical protein
MTTSEKNKCVISLQQAPPALVEIEDANCTGTKYSYRMRWATTELKQKQILFSLRRGE